MPKLSREERAARAREMLESPEAAARWDAIEDPPLARRGALTDQHITHIRAVRLVLGSHPPFRDVWSYGVLQLSWAPGITVQIGSKARKWMCARTLIPGQGWMGGSQEVTEDWAIDRILRSHTHEP